MNILTRKESLELAYKILLKQKSDKQKALFLILEDYKVMLDRDKEIFYQIIPNINCTKCGGIILKKTHIFPRVTCGGNPIIGCPVCNTFSDQLCRKDLSKFNFM